MQAPKQIQIIVAIVMGVSASHLALGQEENLNVFDRWLAWSDGKSMLVRHLNEQAFRYLDERDKEIASLKTKQNWTKRQEKVRNVLADIVGPFPARTPLNAKVTGVIKKDGYKIEKIIFESMPGFYVTAALFLPNTHSKKNPAILFTSGHTIDAFRYPSYQTMILNLVKKGFIVFAIDPIGQGERIQHYDNEKNASAIGGMTTEHSYLGNQCLVTGTSIARYFIWDGIRAIDYLLTRKEIDPSRIGVTGQSGGGTQAAYIFAFDRRIKAAAPVNYITGFRRLLESIGPQDAEQNFYHGLSNGITHADLLEVRASDPVLIAAGTRDFFSIQGARETYEEVKGAYAALDAGDNIELIEDDWGHGYTQKLREGICAFFQKHFNVSGDSKDEDLTLLLADELKVTETGQVATSLKDAETVFSLNKNAAEKLIDALATSRKDIEPHLTKVQLRAQQLSGYAAPAPEVGSVFRGRYPREGYSVEMYALHGEEDYVIPLLLFVPSKGTRFPAVVYIHPKGKIADAAPGGKIEQLVKKGYVVAAPDLIGTGETEGRGNVAMLIGRSMVGIQAGDVIRVVTFLKERKEVDHAKIGAVAFDEMCPILLHAAAFDKSISSVSLIGAPVSYRSMVLNEFYDKSFFNNAVPGALMAYDLPDLLGCIAPRRVALVALKDQMKQDASPEVIQEELSFPRSVYAKKNALQNIVIGKKGGSDVTAGWVPE